LALDKAKNRDRPAATESTLGFWGSKIKTCLAVCRAVKTGAVL